VRLLLDESLPRKLRRELAPHQVLTVSQLGWSGVSNGALLRRAASEGFAAFVTADRNLEYQQNLSVAGITVVVLIAKTNRLAELAPLLPALREALASLQPGTVVRIGE